MWRSARNLVVFAAIIVAAVPAAGCASGKVPGAISSLASSKSISLPSRSPAASESGSPSITATAPSTVTAPPSTVTAPPSTVTAAPGTRPAATSPAAAHNGSGSSLIWLWVLLGVIVVVGVIALVARSAARRRSAAAGSWRSGVIDAYAKGSALYDAMSVAEGWGGPAREDDAVRWADIQRRADDMAQALYALREAAPDPAIRARVAEVLASLQAVRSAMDAERAMDPERAPRAAGARQAEMVRGRLFAFEASLRALRAPEERLT